MYLNMAMHPYTGVGSIVGSSLQPVKLLALIYGYWWSDALHVVAGW